MLHPAVDLLPHGVHPLKPRPLDNFASRQGFGITVASFGIGQVSASTDSNANSDARGKLRSHLVHGCTSPNG